MIRIATLAAASVVGLAVIAGCDRSSNEQDRANTAQAEANQKIADADRQANDKANKAQAEADKKIAAVQDDFSTKREDYRHAMETNLVDLDKKITTIQANEKTATGSKKAELDQELAQIMPRRASFSHDMTAIQTTPAVQWDATKARVDKDWSDLKSLVDKAA